MTHDDVLIWDNAPCINCGELGDQHIGGKCLWDTQPYNGNWPPGSMIDKYVRPHIPRNEPTGSRFDVCFMSVGAEDGIQTIWRVLQKNVNATTWRLIFSLYAESWPRFLEGDGEVF